jgi:TPR repeat protein
MLWKDNLCWLLPCALLPERNGCILTCPFCRACSAYDEELVKMLEKRADSNIVNAILQLGCVYLKGHCDSNAKKDIGKAIKLFHRAAELGSALANGYLGDIYHKGD